MALIGLGSVTIAAMTADLLGNESTRPFTRFTWGAALLHWSGLTVSGLTSGAYDLVGSLGGMI